MHRYTSLLAIQNPVQTTSFKVMIDLVEKGVAILKTMLKIISVYAKEKFLV